MVQLLRKTIVRSLTQRWVHKISWLTFAAALLLSPAVQAQMSGTYTVCSSGCNYSTITAAVTALKSAGINGKTTIEIKPGGYNESIQITSISGLSATNTLTFKGTGTAQTDVRVYNSNSYVIQIYNTSYVTLENMHLLQTSSNSNYYGVDVYSSKNCTIRNCRMEVGNIGTYIYDLTPLRVIYSTDNLVTNSYIRGGGYMGINEGGFTTGSARNTYSNNMITRWYYYANMSYYGVDNKYLNNYYDSAGYTYGYGPYSYSENGAVYEGNTMRGCYYGGGYFSPQAGQTVTFRKNMVYATNYSGFYTANYGTMNVENNMIHVSSSANYGVFLYNYSAAGTINFRHNTVHQTNTGGYTVYFYNYYYGNNNFLNNNITRATSGTLMYHPYISVKDKFEGNNWYNSSGSFAYYGTTTYTSFSAYQSAAIAAYGISKTDNNMSFPYKSTTDLHVDQTKVVPFSKNIGINKDIDGDDRCAYFVTPGADESTYTGSGHYKTPSKPKFTGPSTAYNGSITTYFNAGKTTDPVYYRWYVDNKWVSDSIHLSTTSLKSPSAKVKLIAINCGGKDSMEMTVTVQDPPTAPTSDFISDLNTIRQGERVKFTDLSVGYPSAWRWEISPKTVLIGGTQFNTYKYVYGDTFSPNAIIQFIHAGSFTVCMTASNVKGSGNKECKTAYVEVQPSMNIGDFAMVRNPSGYMYDAGGPNGEPIKSGSRRTLIDPCASDVWLVFNMFDNMCGYRFVRIYDGDKEEKGKELHKCTQTNGYSTIGGLTGGTSFTGCYGTSCLPNTVQNNNNKPDTFHAKSGRMLIVEDNYYAYNNNYGQGFEAVWFSKPTTDPAPVAKFSSVDSICTNGIVTFTNQSTGKNVNYYWDLDGDGSFDPVGSGGNANWPYFFPGNYTITLVAENCGGIDTFQKTIKVFNPASPTVQFSADNTNPTINDVVFLKSDIVECVDEYKWTLTHANGTGVAQFVNGSKNTSQNPQVMFTDTGCYSVELYAKNGSGDDQFKLNCYIRVRSTYCQPSAMNLSQDLGISYVEFGSIKNTSDQGKTAYTSYLANQNQSTILEIGATYPLTIERNTNKNKATRTVWIDWNQNSVFESSEKVAEETNATTLSWTKDVTIPATAKVGASMMRVAITQGSQTNDPCGPLTYGEYEDYRVYVRPDLTIPVITMLGKDTVLVEQGYDYKDAGATAKDNLDGDITALIVKDSSKFSNMVQKTYIWSYNVKDAAGNAAETKRRVVIVTPDKTAPELEVFGSDSMKLQVFQPFNPPVVIRAFDKVDGDITGTETVVSNVINTQVGWYTVTYTLTDINQNTATVIRHVQVIDTIMPTMALVGNATVQHEVGTPYTDAGVNVSDNYYSETELRKGLTEGNNVDENVVGTYTYVYILEDPFTGRQVTVKRTVEVVDTQAPVLSLNGASPVKLPVFDTYKDMGVTISDNYYKNLNSWDTLGTFYQNFKDGRATKLGKYTVIYRVTDPSGNSVDITREIVVVDEVAPVITLKDEQAINVCRWSVYNDAGYTLSDNYYTNDSITVTTEGSFVTMGTALEGVYTLRYVATDRSGNVSESKIRTIYVRNPYEFPCQTQVGIKNVNELDKAVKVYPNPNAGKFTVEANLPANEQVRLTVTNMMGQEIAVISNGSLNANKFTVDLTNHASGIYLLNVSTSNHTVVKRIVVNK